MRTSEVVNRARQVLHDTDSSAYRWSNAVLLQYLSDAQTEIAWHIPTANAQFLPLQLTPGEIRQDILPANAIQLLTVERNLLSEGGRAGQMITEMDLDALIRENRNWSQASWSDTIDNFALRAEDPRRFYVSPPAGKAAWVEVLVSQVPLELADGTNLEESIAVPDHFRHILQLFTQGWALMEDTPNADFPQIGRASCRERV